MKVCSPKQRNAFRKGFVKYKAQSRENEFFLHFGTECSPNFYEGSSSSVTARKLWQGPKGGEGPIDTIVLHRGLPEHSNPEWGRDFAYKHK